MHFAADQQAHRVIDARKQHVLFYENEFHVLITDAAIRCSGP